MPRRAFPELNPEEKDAARAIAGLIDMVRRDDDLLHQHWEPVSGSRLWQDDQKIPHYPISDFATQQFATTIGCIEALAVAGPDVVYSTDGMSEEEEQALSAA